MRPLSLLLAVSALLGSSFGCSSTKSSGGNDQADAQASGGMAGAAGSATTGGGGAGGGVGDASAGQSSGGEAGGTQIGGSNDAGPNPDASADAGELSDASSPRCEELGSPGRTGRQCDPGTEGNGTFQQETPPADGIPPEAMDQGNPHGVLLPAQTQQSAIYGYGFVYQVYVPAQYQPGKAAALMIFQDGGNYPVNFHFLTVLDNFIVSGDMPVTIGLFLNPGSDATRSAEYDALDDKYARFLLQEMIPTLETEYDLVDDPNGWGIGGHSSGGICAFTVGWHYPDKFRKILTNSGSFTAIRGGDQYPMMIQATDPKPLRVTLQSGTNDLNTGAGSWFAANNAMAAALDAKGYAYRYMKGEGSHDVAPWNTMDFPSALRWLWRGYTLPQYSQ